MKKYIHVNQHKIRSNKKNNSLEPVITIKEGKKNTYCSEVEILGPSRIFYGGNEKTRNDKKDVHPDESTSEPFWKCVKNDYR